MTPLETVAENLSPSAVAGWLRMRGFERVGPYGDFGDRFASNDLELIVPLDPSAQDFAKRMAELASDLAEMESRPAQEVLADLGLAPFDVVKVRSVDADEFGSIRLATGLDLHTEARNVVVAAANAAASPQPRRSWRGRRFDGVAEYVESVRLGQSQRGSFVLTLLSRWDYQPSSHDGMELGDVAFGRRVTSKLGTMLQATQSALRRAVSEGVGPLVDAYVAGTSSNLYQALARLARDGNGIDISVNWSASSPSGPRATLVLRRDDAPLLTEAAQELSRNEDEPDFVLQGLVAAIAEPPERFDGSAVVEALIGSGLRRVRVRFDETQRDAIYDAAREKRWIRLVGDLHRDGQRLSLLRPRDVVEITALDGDLPL